MCIDGLVCLLVGVQKIHPIVLKDRKFFYNIRRNKVQVKNHILS